MLYYLNFNYNSSSDYLLFSIVSTYVGDPLSAISGLVKLRLLYIGFRYWLLFKMSVSYLDSMSSMDSMESERVSRA